MNFWKLDLQFIACWVSVAIGSRSDASTERLQIPEGQVHINFLDASGTVRDEQYLQERHRRQ